MTSNQRYAIFSLLFALMPGVAGCNALQAILDSLQPSRTTVELRNEGDFPVSATIFYDNDQETIDGVIQEVGTETQYTIDPGGVQSFSRPCDELQAIIIDDADLEIVGEVGPEANTDVLRDGDEFGCGDTIIFTFTHSNVIIDFDVEVSTVSS